MSIKALPHSDHQGAGSDATLATTNKGQSPMATANWVCSHYWRSEQWSTAAEPGIIQEAWLRLLPLPCHAPPSLLALAVDHLDGTQELREDAEPRGVGGALPARANRFS